MNIPFQQSPNYHSGRYAKITHLVMHAMAGYFTPSVGLFMDPKAQVSSHYCISKTGTAIQLIKEIDTAWHVCAANPFCIGIELEDCNQCLENGTWFVPPLHDAAVELAAEIVHRNDIPFTNIVEHCDPFLRAYKNNHADAGPFFDIQKFRVDVSEAVKKLSLPRIFALSAGGMLMRHMNPVLEGPVPEYPPARCPVALN